MPVPEVSPPSRPLLRDRFDRRQEAVVDAAAAVIAERGFEATSIADLSDRTGLAAGGLYHYIGNKDRLLALICDALLEPLLATVHGILAEDRPAEDQLRAVIRAWLEHVESHRDHMLVFVQERRAMERGPQWRDVRRRRREFERLLEEILARGEAEGSMRFEDRRLTLLALLGMVNYTPQWLRPRGRLSATVIADGYTDMVLSSGRPADAGRRIRPAPKG